MPDQRPSPQSPPVHRPLWPCWDPILRLAPAVPENRLRWCLFAPFALLMCCGYYAVVHGVAAAGRVAWDPTLALDRWVPAVPLALLPYLTHVLYYPACVVCSPTGDEGTRALIGLLQTLAQVALISFGLFLLLPAKVDLRDQLHGPLLTSHRLLREGFAWLHTLDPPFNAWPSLHISHTLVAVLFLQSYERRRLVRVGLWCAWGLLAASTLLTKQHLLFDGLTGAALGWGAWRWGARRYCRPAQPPGPAPV